MITHLLAFAAGAGAVIGLAHWQYHRQARPAAEGTSRVEALEKALEEARTHLSVIMERQQDPMAAKIARAGLRKVRRTLGEPDPLDEILKHLRKVDSHGTSR